MCGPLFNFEGEVVGLNTAIIAGGQGIGFAIPINLAKNIVNQLKSEGKVTRGWLGVIVQQVTPEIAQGLELQNSDGALISDIAPGGPAEKAGLKRGDVIVSVDKLEIKEMPELPKVIAKKKPGTLSSLSIIREGRYKNVRVEIGELPESSDLISKKIDKDKIQEELGLTVAEITPKIKSRLNLKDSKGVIITKVSRGSIAKEAGFSNGDIIIEINAIENE